MAHLHIGIDFGTSQTKICTTNIIDNPLEKGFIFHKFSLNKSYILPTTIKLDENGLCLYGLNEKNLIRYFKMKSLFDDHPNYQIEPQKHSGNTISQKELANYPEVCSILFLTYCILDVRSTFKIEKLSKPKLPSLAPVLPEEQSQPKQSFFSRLFGKRKREAIKLSSESEIQPSSETKIIDANRYFYTIGIPTEYDRTSDNYLRRCKQYEIIYLAIQLSEEFKDVEEYTKSTISQILDKIKTKYHEIDPQLNNARLPQSFYENKGIFVIAETTAGIVPFRNDLQRVLDSLPNEDGPYRRFKNIYMGNYITMDVGAGTTDISFFTFYTASGQVRMKYYASKSIPIASNFLILQYLNSSSLDDILEFNIDESDKKRWEVAQKNIRNDLFDIIRSKESSLYYRIIKLFVNRHRDNWHFEFNIAKGCKVYGGGSRFNEFSKGEMMLHNGGVTFTSYTLQTFTKLERFINSREFKYNIKLVYPNGGELGDSDQEEILNSIDILNTALGLAIVDFKNRPDGENGWIDHPFQPNNDGSDDEGMAMYDIFNRDWI